PTNARGTDGSAANTPPGSRASHTKIAIAAHTVAASPRRDRHATMRTSVGVRSEAWHRGSSRLAGIRPGCRAHDAVAVLGLGPADRDDVQPVGTCLEGANDLGRHAHDIPLAE